jgi:hypothetical protein
VPEPVQVIEIAFFGAEDVDDNVAVIQQEPAGIHGTLVVMGKDPLLFQAELDLFEDGADLPGAIGGADNEIVRKAADTPDVQ